MSGPPEEDDYSANIDDQLLSVAKQEQLHHDIAALRNSSGKYQSAQHGSQHHQQSQHHQGQLQHHQQSQNQHQALPSLNLHHQQQLHNRQLQQLSQQHQSQQQHQQSQQGQHTLQQSQAGSSHSIGAELHHHHHHHYQQPDDLDSEYNIQIPDPIVDSKSKIYPVQENTITAEGNLITRPFPEQAFHNREDLNDFIQEFARDNGFGVVIAHSNKKAIYYTCELGGKYRHKKSKKDLDDSRSVDVAGNYLIDPSTKTKKLRCPFSMTAAYKKSTSVWTLRTTCNEHNHPQLDPLSNHPMLRKRSDELNMLILDLYKVGTKPSHIESKIKEQFPDVLIKREDIYNEIRGYKRKLKKSNAARYNLGHNAGRLAQYKKRGNGDEDATAAAVAAAAAANAILNGTNGEDGQPSDAQVLQYSQSQQQEEFQRQFNEAAAAAAHQHQLDDQQYQQYQHLQEHALNDTDNTAAAAIAAVAHATRHTSHNPYHNDSSDLSMDNIDSRLVGE